MPKHINTIALKYKIYHQLYLQPCELLLNFIKNQIIITFLK